MSDLECGVQRFDLYESFSTPVCSYLNEHGGIVTYLPHKSRGKCGFCLNFLATDSHRFTQILRAQVSTDSNNCFCHL